MASHNTSPKKLNELSKPLREEAQFFLEPATPRQRQYEALRAYFVEQLPVKDRSINKCRMIREGAIIPFGQQGVKDDFQVVLHVGCRIAARFIQTPHHVHRRS